MAAAARADAILLGAMGLPDVRYPDGTEVQPHLDMREKFALYAGIRPVRDHAGRADAAGRSRAPRRWTACWCANPPKACSPPAA